MSRILIVEDEKDVAELVSDTLRAETFDTRIAYDGVVGLKEFREYNPDLIILDVKLPTTDGFTLCRRIRKESSLPIIILTGLSSVEDQLTGYELEADDYITKPFDIDILVAKVRALFRREAYAKFDSSKRLKKEICYDGVSLNEEERRICIYGIPVVLEPKQYDLLRVLMTNVNIVFTRDQLIRIVWRYEYSGNTRVVDTQVTKLRKQLGPKAYMLKTLSGAGYCFQFEGSEKAEHSLT